MPKKQTITGLVTDQLRQLIVSGEFGAGEPLRQDEISVRLGVSRTPLREAIITLQSEGLVVNHPHRGAVVYQPNAQELEEIYEIRILLETHAAREATKRITSEERETVEAIVAQMDATSDPRQLLRLNHEFRSAFYRCSGKRHLVDLIHSYTLRAAPYITMLVSGPRRPFARKEFRALLQAIGRHDAEAAASITRAQLEATVASVVPLLKR